ncbi:hypothetical protein [Lewinella sp. W8]|uniref:hypothetical protein n=1 Tax=Lewinella sp. W8 TaxID=2528208 RepID=UPI001068501A|nr:hypothetical protein [Lewinella sp. W8]MTB51666.1 hypothetical protein [Lewinella sp. W8]
MHRRLTELLRTFGPEELERLDLFLQSPYFNQSQVLLKLGTFYLEYAPTFDDAGFQDTTAFARIFPEHPFQKSRINKYHSLLYGLVREFLVHQSVAAGNEEAYRKRLIAYDQRELAPHFKKEMEQLVRQLDQSPLRNADHYFQRLQLARLNYAYQSRRDERDGDIGLQLLNDALDVHFVIEKLRQLNRMMARKRAVKVEYVYSLLEATQQYLADREVADNPAIRVYQSQLRLQLSPTDPALYRAFKREVLELAKFFTPTEQRELFTSLENMAKYCSSPADYPRELFSLYERQLKDGVLAPEGEIHHSLFRNIISVAIHLRHFGWAEHFLASNAEAIVPGEFREDVCLLAQAELDFYQSRPAAAIASLQRANPKDVYYKLTAKTLQARAYYQLRELTALDNFLNTFTKFIYDQQKRISPGKVKSYRNFINYLRRLTRLATQNARASDQFLNGQCITDYDVLEGLRELRVDVEQEGFFMGCNWLLAEINGLTTAKVADSGRK